MTQSLKELLAERTKLDAEIANVRKAESAAALKKVHELISEFGFTAQQVLPWKPAEKKQSVAKYLDEKSGATWSGRGKPPAWIAGRNRDDFLIERPRPNDGPFLAQMAAQAAERQQS